jgi:hypothetical protein
MYLRCAVELLQQDHPCQSVRQGDGPEGHESVRPTNHLRGEPQGTAEDEDDVTPPRETQREKPLRQLLRGERLALLAVQDYHVGTRRCPLEKPPRLGGEHLLRWTAVQVFLSDLDNLYRKIAPEPLEVFVRAVGGPSFEAADGDYGGAADHRTGITYSTSKSRRVVLSASPPYR